MNPVIIQGRVKTAKKVEAYVHSLAKELGIHRLYSKKIMVQFSTKLDGEAQGYCWGDYRSHAEISIARTSFGVSFTLEEMMQTLAHEMVHAKQYLRRELYGCPMSWKGAKPRKYSYDNSPWEQEAYALEEQLFKKHWV